MHIEHHSEIIAKFVGSLNITLPSLIQPANTCSKLTIETLEQCVKYVQSQQ